MQESEQPDMQTDGLAEAIRMQAAFLEEQMAMHGICADAEEDECEQDTLMQARTAFAECGMLLEQTRAAWLSQHNELVFSGQDSDALGARIDALDRLLLALEKDAVLLDALVEDT